MRHGSNNSNNRRGRNNRPARRGSGNQGGRSQVFDSNGPDVRIRGTAPQVAEKYQALAKDAASAGDFILAESYLQHAEHYVRLVGEFENNANVSRDVQSNAGQQSNAGIAEDDSSKSFSRSKAEKTQAKPADDDLGLPSSILGVDPGKQEQATEEA